MILLKSVSYKNFKSVGNTPIKVELDKTKTTLLTGVSGAGKSTVTSALAFGLFGEDFVLNKNSLINSINQKQLEVIVEFDVDKVEYKVVRGIKPNIFKIYENGKNINEDAASRDYQKILETQILKMNLRAFSQVVVVGGRNYTPFMSMKPADRREFIEDLLDIRVFSTMGSILKEQIKTLKQTIKDTDDSLKTIKEKVDLQHEFVKKLTNEKSVSVNKIEDSIRGIRVDNEDITKQIDSLLLLEEEIVKKSTIIRSSGEWLTNLTFQRKTANNDLNKGLELKKFFAEESHCPTCFQNIEDHHKLSNIEIVESKIALAEAELLDLHTQIINCEKLVSKYAKFQDDITDIQTQVRILQNKLQNNLTLIENAEEQISDIKNDSSSIDFEKYRLKDFAKNYLEAIESKKQLLVDQQHNDFMLLMLTDGGIKQKIIRQYIPHINKSVNKYLNSMDLFLSYTLDENFVETIKSRHRDNFTYNNFSDGQKARIDLALMFAWRDVARMRNAVNCNLLVLDEVDASVDAVGSALISDLLKTFDKSNIILVTHKGDQTRDKVDRTIDFEIKNNFTEVKES
jgi:DNA repair exonuclease SbcCD ATPase subunit